MPTRTVLITGGTSGIGRACALAFGRAGYQVAITGRDETKLADTAAALA
ncbi:SDR family NAD(P)-dependent oxidoreductase, partial [Hymenobacter agri]